MRRKKPQNEDIRRTNRGQIAPNFASDSRWQQQWLPAWLTTSHSTVKNVIRNVFLTPQTEEDTVNEMEKHLWYHKLKHARDLQGWSRAYVAERIGVDIKTVSRWERGEAFPQSRYRHDMVKLFGMNAADLGLIEDEEKPEVRGNLTSAYLVSQPFAQTTQDWGEAPHVEACYGRQQESEILKRWILDKHCRMIAILGIGGIGKTTFTTMLAHQISNEFTYVIWRSLQNAPPVEQIIASCLQFAPEQQQGNQPDLNQQCTLLLAFLRKHRCLIILDNVESIFETGQRAGRYVNHHDGYSMLFQRLGETDHQSCLLLTSREKPNEMIRMESNVSRVRTFPLSGIGQDDGQQLLKERDLFGSPIDWTELIHIYSGNPLALKLVAEPIRELFGGNIADFLAEEEFVFGGIDDLIAQQFLRLTRPEKHLLYNLAIEREPTSRLDLLENMRHAYPKSAILLDALESLRRRSLVEVSEHEHFTLQPVIREYVTTQFVEQISEEIIGTGRSQETISSASTQFQLLNIQSVLKAFSKDYIRQSQEKQIVEPILQKLQQAFGTDECILHLKSMLAFLHKKPQYQNGYAAGTLLNLLTYLAADLRGLDCSHLAIRQAYLQGIALPDINFQGANLATTVFTDTFSSILCIAVSPGGQMLAAGTITNEVRLWQLDGLVPLFNSHQYIPQVRYSPGNGHKSNESLSPQQTRYDYNALKTSTVGQSHTDNIRAITFDPSGRLLATGSEDRTIHLWDAGTGVCLAILIGHTDWVRSIAFSPDGLLLASGSEDHTIRLWHVETGECLHVLQGHTQRVRAVAFSPQGSLLASGGNDSIIRLWDTQTWECSGTLAEHNNYIRTLAFHPKGEILASGNEDTTIRLWHIPTGTCLTTLYGHKQRISALTFAAEGVLLASGSYDLTIRLWDVQQHTCLRTLYGHENRIWSLASVPGRNIVVSASEDQTIRLWDIVSGACAHILRGYTSLIKTIAFSPDGKLLADATEERMLHLWNVESGHCLHILRGHANRIRSIAFSPDGNLLASASEDETIRLWNVATGFCIRILTGHTHLIRNVVFSPDGKTLASCSHDQTIRLWNCATGQNYKTLLSDDGIVWTIAISPDGMTLASGNDNATIRLWDIQTGTCLKVLKGHSHRIWCVKFSPDGTLIASTSDDGTIRIWERTTGTCIRSLGGTVGAGLAPTRTPTSEQTGHNAWIRTISFSPDGCYLASGSHDQTVCIWDVTSGECRFQLVGHSNVVWSVAFSPTEPVLASAGDDGTIRLWDYTTGEYIKMVGEERLCERMNITDAHGLSIAQRQTLLSLGAIDTNT